VRMSQRDTPLHRPAGKLNEANPGEGGSKIHQVKSRIAGKVSSTGEDTPCSRAGRTGMVRAARSRAKKGRPSLFSGRSSSMFPRGALVVIAVGTLLSGCSSDDSAGSPTGGDSGSSAGTGGSSGTGSPSSGAMTMSSGQGGGSPGATTGAAGGGTTSTGTM